jgi:hypothetical protein
MNGRSTNERGQSFSVSRGRRAARGTTRRDVASMTVSVDIGKLMNATPFFPISIRRIEETCDQFFRSAGPCVHHCRKKMIERTDAEKSEKE